MLCCTLLYVHSSIAIILMGKRELIALLSLSSWCLVMVERLFLAVPRGCLQFVIVVFPDHTHLLFLIFYPQTPTQPRPWYPGIRFRLPCTPQDNFSWVPNCSLGPPGWETKVSSNKFWFGLCEIAWFLCQPIANLRRGSAYKITHISAVTYPRLLNLIPN